MSVRTSARSEAVVTARNCRDDFRECLALDVVILMKPRADQVGQRWIGICIHGVL
jgi:hypothetical protein